MSATPRHRSQPARRRIAVVTGTRAEYGLLRTVMRAIDAHRRLELQLVVTGSHLLRSAGYTVRAIERDGWRIDARVRMQTGRDTPTDQAEGLARGIAGIARYLVAAETDVVVVLGDRIEALAGGLAAVTTGRLVAHLHGGDIAPGDFDDPVRHALTKLAHVHLTATKQSGQRVLRMGEEPARVHVVGAPGLDDLLTYARTLPPRLPKSGQALILQHASGRPADREKRVMARLLRAVAAAGLARVIIQPNTDRGHAGIRAATAEHQSRSQPGEVTVHASLDREAYLHALARADVLVGNSSSGILEAPLLGTPVVNVGDRQAGRQRAGRAVVDTAETEANLRQALRAALRKRPRIAPTTPYGDGSAGERVARILAALPRDAGFRHKTLAYGAQPGSPAGRRVRQATKKPA